MTKLERIMLVVLLVLVVGIAVFWKDVQRVLGGSSETTVDRELRNGNDKDKNKKDKDKEKKKKDKKDKDDDKDEAMNAVYHLGPAFS